VPRQVDTLTEAINEYLPYYNTERLHRGLDFKTPAKCF